MLRPLFLLTFLLTCLLPFAHAESRETAEGDFSHEECITCHQTTEPQLVADWQQSVHAATEPVALCTSCHGRDHQGVAARSRRNDSCVDCHGGATSPVVHSYATSKHGIIMQLEQKNYDWNQPLREANYRTPGCAYCHLHSGNHLTAKAEALKPAEADMDRITGSCLDCHGISYINRLNDNAVSMIEIARMKVREARQLVDEYANEHQAPADAELTGLMQETKKHLRNVYLGAFHQSPDYQWWHGQPALDGDLLRIKGFISNRQQNTGDGDKISEKPVR
ncbi:MAG: multiheme c-type cytochrome [Gammaproteobacteria bacterium]|nr:multiheme c-type cytochrome [Gammaproteobacteria bacterium]